MAQLKVLFDWEMHLRVCVSTTTFLIFALDPESFFNNNTIVIEKTLAGVHTMTKNSRASSSTGLCHSVYTGPQSCREPLFHFMATFENRIEVFGKMVVESQFGVHVLSLPIVSYSFARYTLVLNYLFLPIWLSILKPMC